MRMWTAVLVPAIAIASKLPRGVAPQVAELYKPDSDGSFSCIGNPEIRIPFSRVNDDYCDCPDGSDEPGTAACNNGKFWCENKGHISQYIPSRLVGDGVCDYDVCCDGSDEAPGLCPNRCKEVHQAHIEKLRYEKEVRNEGSVLREGLLREAAQRKADEAFEVEKLRARIDELQTEFNAAEAETKRLEVEDADFGTGADAESMQRLSDIKAGIEQQWQQSSNLWQQAQSLLDSYNKLSSALETMSREYNPNFNDPAVKAAIREWREETENNSPSLEFQPRELQDDLARVDAVKVASVSGAASAGSLVRRIASWMGASTAVDALRTLLLDWGVDFIGPGPGDSDASIFESPRVKAARVHEAKLRNELSDTNRRSSELKDSIARIFGPDDIGRALRDTCIERSIGDYKFSVCLYGSTTQRGNGQTNSLGQSQGLEAVGDDGTLKIRFEDGTQCWQGPKRSAVATIRCGIENALVAVEEPNKCAYSIELVSPAACIADNTGNSSEIDHDEL